MTKEQRVEAFRRAEANLQFEAWIHKDTLITNGLNLVLLTVT